MAFKGAQLNYPTHEQEFLSIIHALKCWCTDLLGMHIHIFTDHKTLQNFNTQADLSCRQAHWMEFLQQYEYMLHYVKGEDNTVADALSQMPIDDKPSDFPADFAGIFTIQTDPSVLRKIRLSYIVDPFCARLFTDIGNKMRPSNATISDGLMYLGDHLVIPRTNGILEQLFTLAHDSLGHFSGDKSYAALRDLYYWPNM